MLNELFTVMFIACFEGVWGAIFINLILYPKSNLVMVAGVMRNINLEGSGVPPII